MITIDVDKIRMYTKMSIPAADFDGKYTFYYDETNNIRKFYVREFDFNSGFTENFVLGGLVHEGSAPDVQPLIDSFKLQKNIKEVRFKHIAKGDFLDCLKSQKLNLFLKFIKDSRLNIHYSNLNVLYWSIVDIVDSAIINSEVGMKLGPLFANKLKDDLYNLSRREIETVIDLFYRYEYPNIKEGMVTSFIDEMINVFEQYIDDFELHFGLESLRQILKQAKKNRSFPFVMDEEDYLLIKDFSMFYMRPIYLFKNSTHIFDDEDSISGILRDYKIMDVSSEVKNYSFVDSEKNKLVQLSDILVGLLGKLARYLNTGSREKIYNDFCSLTLIQGGNIDLLLDLIDKSHNNNIGFLHTIDSYEEMSKIGIIRSARRK